MTARFWGVRGSIASPGPSTVRYGGNTSCVSIDLAGDKILVLDAGTGIRECGKAAAASGSDVYVLLSHAHWDHIQGFPFFSPIYEPNRTVHIFPTQIGQGMICSLIEQMDGSHFPVNPEDLPSHPNTVTEDQMGFLHAHSIDIRRIATNHPGGGFGYRIEAQGRSLVYLTDNELDPPYPRSTDFQGFVQFCRNADVLIHDAQYVEADLPQKHGWGHSLVSQARDLAAAARVKRLVLFHHDPERTDDEIDTIQDEVRSWLRNKGSETACTAAHEGLQIEL